MKTLCLPLSSILRRAEQFCLTFPIFLMMLAKDRPWGHKRKLSTGQGLQATVWAQNLPQLQRLASQLCTNAPHGSCAGQELPRV